MKLEKHLELITEITTLDPRNLREGKSNPQELANYYHEMRRLNPKASPWLIFLGMADEAGVSPPKLLDKYPDKLDKEKKEPQELDKQLRQYETQLEKILKQFPPKERREIKKAQAPTGGFLPQMSGTEVATKLGMTRQAVSSATKKALPKVYMNVRAEMPQLGPFDAFMEAAKRLHMREQAGKVLRLMPKKYQDEIKKDAGTKFRK